MDRGEVTLQDFYSEFMEQIALAKDSSSYGWTDEDFFTSVFLEYMEDLGEVEDPVICPYRDRGLQLNAWVLSEDMEALQIYVSCYNDTEALTGMGRTEIDAALKRAVQLFRRCVDAKEKLYQSFSRDNSTYEFAATLNQNRDKIKRLQVIALTNGTLHQIQIKGIELAGVDIQFATWDMDRLYRCMISGKMRETIEIDLEKSFGQAIPSIESNPCDEYQVYLAILSGDILADLYDQFGARLLERNVRSFLQAKGGVNKGIRDTLRTEPQMFLAYNNGISATAESVEIVRDENGRPSIKKIRDLQIVNGGQTTASVFTAKKDRRNPTDLSKVFVQMKLSVIRSAEDMDVIVPNISLYANTQNKVQMADFSANDPFHRKLEELSRTIWAAGAADGPPLQWFYERSRGQYTDMLSRESTPKRKKDFKDTHPLFTKTDLAKYEQTWEQFPYEVSEGAQKNFKKFTVALKNRGNFVPDELYYRRLIAKAILFRQTEKIVAQQKYGGYRANIVTYTIAFLSFRSAQKLDLESIWKAQRLSGALSEEIVSVAAVVSQLIMNPPDGQNITEWCKKPACWERIKNYRYEISPALNSEMIELGAGTTFVGAAISPTGINAATEDETALVDKVAAISARTWFALSNWAKETNNFDSWQRSICFSVGRVIASHRRPSVKQARQAYKVYEEAARKGFRPE